MLDRRGWWFPAALALTIAAGPVHAAGEAGLASEDDDAAIAAVKTSGAPALIAALSVGLRPAVASEVLGALGKSRDARALPYAAEFDAVHSVERARAVGSVHRIIAAADLRPELIAAVERGMARIDAR